MKNTNHNFAMAIANQFLSILINIYQKNRQSYCILHFLLYFCKLNNRSLI